MAELDDLRWRLKEMKRDKERLVILLNQRNGEFIAARTQVDHLVKILSGIHMLLFPPIVHAGGRDFRFKPKPVDAADYMQALSDRIRAIPDEIEKAKEENRNG